MRIAVINETSAADKNKDILTSLEGRGHVIINAGMTNSGEQPELTYIHTGFIAALLLNLKRVDFIIGGCGTGQGFLNSVMQYPGVFCGHILTPLDAWLFTQINGGNCISLALNQGYGWASDVNLKFIFDRLFSVECGIGYPPYRRDSQQMSRKCLADISQNVHYPFVEVVKRMPESIIKPSLNYPGMADLIDIPSVNDKEMADALKTSMAE